MSERKTTQDRLGRDPDGSGCRPSDETPTGSHASGASIPRAGAPEVDDLVLVPRLCDVEALYAYYAVIDASQRCHERTIGAINAYVAEAARCASDERRDGRDDDSRLGAKPASAVGGADSDGEAPDPELSGLAITEAICLDKLKRENAELREAYRATLHAARLLLRSARANLDGQTEQAEALYDAVERMDDVVGSHPFARTLLSQSTEGGET